MTVIKGKTCIRKSFSVRWPAVLVSLPACTEQLHAWCWGGTAQVTTTVLSAAHCCQEISVMIILFSASAINPASPLTDPTDPIPKMPQWQWRFLLYFASHHDAHLLNVLIACLCLQDETGVHSILKCIYLFPDAKRQNLCVFEAGRLTCVVGRGIGRVCKPKKGKGNERRC